MKRPRLERAKELASRLTREELAKLKEYCAQRLADFAEIPSSEADQIRRVMVEGFSHNGSTYQRKYIQCGKKACRVYRQAPAHRPYWYRYWREGEKMRFQYNGKQLKE